MCNLGIFLNICEFRLVLFILKFNRHFFKCDLIFSGLEYCFIYRCLLVVLINYSLVDQEIDR